MNSGKKIFTVTVIVVSVVLFLWFARIGIGLFRYFFPPEFTFKAGSVTLITDEVALEYTHKALLAAKIDLSEAYPVKRERKEPEKYFMRNSFDPNDGYVQWVTQDGAYGVRLKKEGNVIKCAVYEHW